MGTAAASGSNAATLFLTNLQLLGFVPEKITTGIFSKIVFDEHMFSHANNNKAFEATSHFLFHKLDASRTKKEFAKCWPLTKTDYQRKSSEYRSIAYRWLDELRIKQCLIGQVTLRKSYFQDCRGEKLNAIMLAFSTYVLQKVVDRRLAVKEKQEGIEHAPIRILEATSINMPSKENLIKNLETEIDRMANSMAQDNQTMRSSNETWARMARKITSNDSNSTSFSSPNPESKRYKNKPQWNGMDSILQTLTTNLDKLNRENQKLHLASAQKEEQLRKMSRPTDFPQNIFSVLSEPFPVEKDPVVDDVPPLALPNFSADERKKRVQKFIEELVTSRIAKKRQHELESKHGNDRSKKQRVSLPPPSPKETLPQPTPSPAPDTSFAVPSPSRAAQFSPARYAPAQSSPLSRRVSTVSNSTRHQPPATPRNRTLGSPFSYISEKVSPLSNTFPDYCEKIVNQMMEDFQEKRTPDNMKILSPIDNHSIKSGRLSTFSQPKHWPTPSPFSQKLAASLSRNDSSMSSPTRKYIAKEHKTEAPLSTLWDYYEDNNMIDDVYQNSPTRRSVRSSSAVSRYSHATPRSNKTSGASSVAANSEASSLHAYKTAMYEQDKEGAELLDETEPDMFYTSDFTIQT